MGVAVTLGAQAQSECRQNKQGYPSFGWSEAEFFSQFTEMSTRFQQSRNFWALVVDVTIMSRSNHNRVVVMPDVRVIKARL